MLTGGGNSEILELDPGGRLPLLPLVRHRPALVTRHGLPAPIAGEFRHGSGLANDGARLLLLEAQGQEIQDCEYRTRPPWPAVADGVGVAPALRRPESLPDPRNVLNWRATRLADPAPGRDDRLSYRAWQERFFEADELADPAISGPGGRSQRGRASQAGA